MFTITNKVLADIIGKESTPDGRVFWEPEDLSQIKIALRALQIGNKSETFLIDASMPYWLYLSIMAALAPCPVELNTPNYGPVAIPRNTPQGVGEALTFRVYEDATFTLVEFSSPRSLQTSELATIIPPQVNTAKGVVISSNAPPWIIATVGLAYCQEAPWVACTQKNGGAIICAAQARGVKLGSEIDQQAIDAVANKVGCPKRGEIWTFDDGYKERPGVIISPSLRNEQLEDVLIVPFTTSDSNAYRHLLIPRAGTGLIEDSYARCTNITRVNKQLLVKGPIGTLPDLLMAQVIRAVRLAIGDVEAA
ncbi:MAG: hypothetical protein C0469_00470 [Cyanobacteria bacterium DS2.3.42]|nr:hypothetical protein [Cyanobacteria bacterium DS2.3.42]